MRPGSLETLVCLETTVGWDREDPPVRAVARDSEERMESPVSKESSETRDILVLLESEEPLVHRDPQVRRSAER